MSITKFNKNQIPEGTGGSTPPMPEVDGKTYGIKDQEWSEITGGSVEGYVPYESDGLSIAVKEGGELRIGDNAIAKIVSAEGQLTPMSDIEYMTDVGGTTIYWNGTLPIHDSAVGMIVSATSTTTKVMYIFVCGKNTSLRDVDTPGGVSYIITVTVSETGTNGSCIYLDGDYTIAQQDIHIVLDIPITYGDSPTQGWNVSETQISSEMLWAGGLDTPISDPRYHLLSSSTTWGVDLAMVGYSEPDRLEIGDKDTPLKLRHLEGRRIIEEEVDSTGSIVAEHTIARTTDLGSYVPYNSDGKSISTKADGEFKLGDLEFAKIVPAEGAELKKLIDLVVGERVDNMTLNFNGSLPIEKVETDALHFADSFKQSISDDHESTISIYYINVSDDIAISAFGMSGGVFIWLVYEDNNESVIKMVYVNGDIELFKIIFDIEEITGQIEHGWNIESITFKGENWTYQSSDAEPLSNLVSTDTSYGFDLATIGYPEPDRLEIGNEKSPMKLRHLKDRRLIEQELDENGAIVAEHILARISDENPYIRLIAGSQRTKLTDIKVGDDLSGMTIEFNGNNLPFVLENDMYAIQINIDFGQHGYMMFTYQQGNHNIGINIQDDQYVATSIIDLDGTWHTDLYTFPEGSIVNRIDTFGADSFLEFFDSWEQFETYLQSDSWKPSMATVGYSQKSRLEIGNEDVPPKILVPTGERIISKEKDGTEHTIAYTSDIPPFTEVVSFDTTTGVISAGEHTIGYVDPNGENSFGIQNLHTIISSVDRPEVVLPTPEIKQRIENPNMLPWENNAEFKDPSPNGWRIPTWDEIVALDAAGRGGWTHLNGTYGRYLGGGNNVFFPANGVVSEGYAYNQGTEADYWTSTPATASGGKGMSFDSYFFTMANVFSYMNGHGVRCVRDISTTDFDPCPAGEYQVGDIIWAKSNLSNAGTFAQNPEDYGCYFQWGQNVAIGADGKPIAIRHKVAYLSDIPTPPPTVRFNVTNMFTFNPAVPDAKVWMRDDGQQKPEIEIIANNSSNNTNDLIITPASGFGSWYDMTGMKAIQSFGKDISSGASGIYDITITGETDQAQSIITVPKEVNNIDFIYFLGQTEVPRASYWVDSRDNASYPFELANTPLSDMHPVSGSNPIITINGISVPTLYIRRLVFGTSYESETIIPQALCYGMSNISELDLRGLKNVTTWNWDAFNGVGTNPNTINIQIGNMDASIISRADGSVFGGAQYIYTYIYANTQAGGEAFKAKFPNLANATIVVNQ